MTDPTRSLLDPVLQSTIAAGEKSIKAAWLSQEESLKNRLQALRRLREAAETEVLAVKETVKILEDRTQRTLRLLVTDFEVEEPVPSWSFKDDLVPPTIRYLLEELRGVSRPLPSPAPSSSHSGHSQQPNRQQEVGQAVADEVTVSVRASESLPNSGSPVRP